MDAYRAAKEPADELAAAAEAAAAAAVVKATTPPLKSGVSREYERKTNLFTQMTSVLVNAETLRLAVTKGNKKAINPNLHGVLWTSNHHGG